MNNSPNKNVKTISCPECDTPLEIPDRVCLGRIIECPACGSENEFVNLKPLTLSPLEEEK